jgi:disulfide bond formation protein DsbB
VIVVTAFFGLIAFARSLKRFEARHFGASIIMLIVLAGFAVALYVAGIHLGDVVGPTLQNLEAASSP